MTILKIGVRACFKRLQTAQVDVQRNLVVYAVDTPQTELRPGRGFETNPGDILKTST